MGVSLISDAAKEVYKGRMADLFHTFKRPHTFSLYQTPTKSVVTMDPEYSSNWGFIKDGTVNFQEIKATFDVRIWFPSFPQNYLTYQPNDREVRVKMAQDVGTLKIQCEEDCYNFLMKAENAMLFDTIYRLDTDVRRLGLFDMDLFTFTMIKQS
jgi:hypothetical protein